MYVDGWNFYHGIDKPDLHPLGFCDFRRLGKRLLGAGTTVDKVTYFTSKDHNPYRKEKQEFWLDALRSVGIEVADPGFFQYSEQKHSHEEKTTDVCLALRLAEDARTGSHDTVLLISADADFVPALELAKKHKRDLIVRVAFPPGHKCRRLEAIDPFTLKIDKADLEDSLFDGDGRTERGVRLAGRSRQFGWAFRRGDSIVLSRIGGATD